MSKNSPRPAPQELARGNPSTSERAAHNRDRRLRRKLLAWWDAGHNDLPWRGRADSYGIWISEAMAQQTRLAVVAPAWERFLKRFPDIESLATADEDEVLSLWSGLGYYSRARSLHRAAQTLHAAGASSFPDTWEEARALPGVGDYTAAAVLSISHQRPYAAVDGNVTRVLSRLDRLGPADNKREPYAERAQAVTHHAMHEHVELLKFGSVLIREQADALEMEENSERYERYKKAAENWEEKLAVVCPV